MADVFISYSRKDKGFATRLHQALTGRQREAWVDLEDIPPTAEWRETISRSHSPVLRLMAGASGHERAVPLQLLKP